MTTHKSNIHVHEVNDVYRAGNCQLKEDSWSVNYQIVYGKE